MEQPLFLIARSWADYGPASAWQGQLIRRLTPQTVAGSHLDEMGSDSAVQVKKKWTRLEPSIRFY